MKFRPLKKAQRAQKAHVFTNFASLIPRRIIKNREELKSWALWTFWAFSPLPDLPTEGVTT